MPAPSVIAGSTTPAPLAARDRQQVPRDGEEQDEHRPQPDRRHRHAEQRQQARAVVDGAVAVERREHAERQRHQQRHQHADERQLQRRREALAEDRQHRLAAAQRMSEVAAHQPAEEGAVLHEQRPVEPEVVAQRRDVGALRPLAEHDLHRVAGDDVDEREDERGGEQRRRHHLREAPQQVAAHSTIRSWRTRYDSACRVSPRRRAASARLPCAARSASSTRRRRKVSTC
jgi:hypothetical protein